jgi:hypothetical protein
VLFITYTYIHTFGPLLRNVLKINLEDLWAATKQGEHNVTKPFILKETRRTSAFDICLQLRAVQHEISQNLYQRPYARSVSVPPTCLASEPPAPDTACSVPLGVYPVHISTGSAPIQQVCFVTLLNLSILIPGNNKKHDHILPYPYLPSVYFHQRFNWLSTETVRIFIVFYGTKMFMTVTTRARNPCSEPN